MHTRSTRESSTTLCIVRVVEYAYILATVCIVYIRVTSPGCCCQEFIGDRRSEI